jgi:hypothetical protein
MGGIVKKIAAWLVVACIAAAPVSAFAEERKSTAAGLGAASALCSLVYGPTKIVYAALGSVISGFAWVLSGGDNDVAAPILTASLRGDYVITPSILSGDDELNFVGQDPSSQMAVSSGYDEGF